MSGLAVSGVNPAFGKATCVKLVRVHQRPSENWEVSTVGAGHCIGNFVAENIQTLSQPNRPLAGIPCSREDSLTHPMPRCGLPIRLHGVWHVTLIGARCSFDYDRL